jgi:hypothetical protein
VGSGRERETFLISRSSPQRVKRVCSRPTTCANFSLPKSSRCVMGKGIIAQASKWLGGAIPSRGVISSQRLVNQQNTCAQRWKNEIFSSSSIFHLVSCGIAGITLLRRARRIHQGMSAKSVVDLSSWCRAHESEVTPPREIRSTVLAPHTLRAVTCCLIDSFNLRDC